MQFQLHLMKFPDFWPQSLQAVWIKRWDCSVYYPYYCLSFKLYTVFGFCLLEPLYRIIFGNCCGCHSCRHANSLKALNNEAITMLKQWVWMYYGSRTVDRSANRQLTDALGRCCMWTSQVAALICMKRIDVMTAILKVWHQNKIIWRGSPQQEQEQQKDELQCRISSWSKNKTNE